MAFSMAAKLLCTLTTQLMLEEMHDGQKYDKKWNFGKLLSYCFLQKIESTPMILLPKLLCSKFFFFKKLRFQCNLWKNQLILHYFFLFVRALWDGNLVCLTKCLEGRKSISLCKESLVYYVCMYFGSFFTWLLLKDVFS